MTVRARRIAEARHDAGREHRRGRRRPATLLLSEGEAAQFAALRTALPEGWVAELQAEAGMAWLALIYDADAPRSRPMFTVCRWDDRVGLLAQWMNGTACSATAFTELWPILELVLDGILSSPQACLATVPTKGTLDQGCSTLPDGLH